MATVMFLTVFMDPATWPRGFWASGCEQFHELLALHCRSFVAAVAAEDSVCLVPKRI
jgi:hypothetical protein